MLLSTENKKINPAISDILKTIGKGVNMITRQMTPFFSYTPYALSIGMFQGLQNSIPCIKFWSVKYTFTCQRRHFQAC